MSEVTVTLERLDLEEIIRVLNLVIMDAMLENNRLEIDIDDMSHIADNLLLQSRAGSGER